MPHRCPPGRGTGITGFFGGACHTVALRGEAGITGALGRGRRAAEGREDDEGAARCWPLPADSNSRAAVAIYSSILRRLHAFTSARRATAPSHEQEQKRHMPLVQKGQEVKAGAGQGEKWAGHQ